MQSHHYTVALLPLGGTLFLSKSAVNFGRDLSEHQRSGDSTMAWSGSEMNLLHNRVIHSYWMLTVPQTLSNRPLQSTMILLRCFVSCDWSLTAGLRNEHLVCIWTTISRTLSPELLIHYKCSVKCFSIFCREKDDGRFTLQILKACRKDLGLYKCSLKAANISVSTSEYHLTSEGKTKRAAFPD